MTDGEMVGLLLEHYREQYGLYLSEVEAIPAARVDGSGVVDPARLIAVLEKRKDLFSRIKEIDQNIAPHRARWEERKNELATVEAETLKALLRKIKDLIGRVMEDNKRLEQEMSKVFKT